MAIRRDAGRSDAGRAVPSGSWGAIASRAAYPGTRPGGRAARCVRPVPAGFDRPVRPSAGRRDPQPAARHLSHTARQERPLGVVRRKAQRALVGGGRLRAPPEPAQQVGASRVEEVVLGERAVGAERLDEHAARRPGPSAIATATARLSSTTGRRATAREHAVEARRSRGQSVSRPRSALGVARRRSPPAAGTGPAARPRSPRSAASTSAEALGDLGRGPSAIGPGPRAGRASPSAPVRASRRESWSSRSARSAARLGLVRHERRRAARASRIASAHRSRRTSASPRGGAVALVEDQVERPRARRRAAPGSRSSGGTRYGMPASRIFFFARTIRWASVASGTRNARAISGVVRPPSVRRVSATRASRASAGWQQVKISRRRSSARRLSLPRRTIDSVPRGHAAALELGAASPPWRRARRRRSRARLRAVVVIQAPGLAGIAVTRPRLEGGHEGVRDGLLGERRSPAEQPDQRRERPAGFLAEQVALDAPA